MMQANTSPELSAKDSNAAAIVSVRDVSMVFPNGTVALKDANLEIAQGEFISLIGPRVAAKPPCCACWPT